jgi:tRNA threonylcarbamoyl adenosine modification protein YjeE
MVELSQVKNCKSEEALSLMAREFSQMLSIGDVVLLNGEMGTGKTFFTTHVYEALGGDPRYACSPSFTLVNHYELPKEVDFFHIDLYRLDGFLEEDELDQDRWMNPHTGYSFVEWPERAGDWLPEKGFQIELEHAGIGRNIRIERLN